MIVLYFTLVLINLSLSTQLLGSLPGVNPDDPAIQEALRKAKEDEDKKDDKDSK